MTPDTKELIELAANAVLRCAAEIQRRKENVY